MTIVIEPVSESTLYSAIDVVMRVFSFETMPNPHHYFSVDEHPYPCFVASLYPHRYHEYLDKIGVAEIHYYVAVDGDDTSSSQNAKSKTVLGTIGLYTYKDDAEDAIWIGWYCVDKTARGRGVGSALLRFVIEKAKSSSKKWLRLWTSDAVNEETANQVYEKNGLKVTSTEEVQQHDCTCLIYRELLLESLRQYQDD